MKLHYLAGDRTAAIRQYERCVNSLRQELGVKPERRTVNLYERIKSDQLSTYELENPPSVKTNRSPQPDVVGRLRQLQALLTAVQRRIQRDIRAVEASPHPEKKNP